MAGCGDSPTALRRRGGAEGSGAGRSGCGGDGARLRGDGARLRGDGARLRLAPALRPPALCLFGAPRASRVLGAAEGELSRAGFLCRGS